MTTPKPGNNSIATLCIISGVLLTAYIFAASRNDPGLRMAALVAATSIASALIAIASTMLVGTNVMTKPPQTDPNELPPGSVVTTNGPQETVQTPPIAPVAQENPTPNQ